VTIRCDVTSPWAPGPQALYNRANLDVRLQLLTPAGRVLASSNPMSDDPLTALPAVVTYMLPGPGAYYVTVAPTGQGDSPLTGYRWGWLGLPGLPCPSPARTGPGCQP
jgi:hypothetical protein